MNRLVVVGNDRMLAIADFLPEEKAFDLAEPLSRAELVRSTDAGRRWQPVALPTRDSVHTIAVADSFLATDRSGNSFASIDGRSWVSVDTPWGDAGIVGAAGTSERLTVVTAAESVDAWTWTLRP